ncbi:MAG: hypothetical protein V1879_02610 [Pseudomonadota bacterium]
MNDHIQRIRKNVRSYLGMELPERQIPLHFVLPAPVTGMKLEDLGNKDTRADLADAAKMPQEYFKLLQSKLRFLPRVPVSSGQRLSQLDIAEQLFFPKALEQVAELAKHGGIPDSEKRQQVLDSIAEIAQAMLLSYQIVFQEYYAGDNFHYARNHGEVLHCATRILELVAFRQTVLGLRYQQMSERDWQTANATFHVMQVYEDTSAPIISLGKKLNLNASYHYSSLQDVFITIQLIGLVDIMSWPTHLHGFLRNYIVAVSNPVQFRLDDGSSVLDRNSFIAECHGKTPLRRGRTSSRSALILDCRTFLDAVRRDCMNLVASKRDRKPDLMPERFFRIQDIERYVVSDLLTRAFLMSETTVIPEQEQKAADLRVYVGFQAVFSLLRNTFNRGDSERLVDKLAKRSALMAEDHVATTESVWFMLHQDSKMIRLRTQETQFTTSMEVGALLSYGMGDEAVNSPRLAAVSRIHRPSAKMVVIDLFRLARYAEPVAIFPKSDLAEVAGDEKGYAALLLHDELIGGWCLAFPPQGILLAVKEMTLKRGDKSYDLTLAGLRNVTTDFYVFATSLTTEQLGMEGKPEYPVPKKPMDDLDGSRWNQRFI